MTRKPPCRLRSSYTGVFLSVLLLSQLYHEVGPFIQEPPELIDHGIHKLFIALFKTTFSFHRISPRPRCRHGVSEVRDTTILPRLANGGEDLLDNPILKLFCIRKIGTHN